jgi:arylsulfatase A-like enzyme
VTQLDVLPTLASLAGVPLLGPVAGRDLTRLVAPAEGVVGVAYTDGRYRQASLLGEDGRKVIVECGERVTAGRPRRELYDLGSDPEEQRDLAPARPAEADALEERLWASLGIAGCEELSMRRAATGSEELDPETRRQLEALGYGTQER